MTPPHLPPGRVDIHSHLLPGIDDGCRIVEESFDCVHRLKARGYVGTICTPHFVPEMFPNNTAENVRGWVAQLRDALANEGIEYAVWAGGEIRMFNGVADWLKHNEPPTLGGGKCLLFDFWTDKWPKWVVPEFERVIAMGYQPILAHPERLGCTKGLEDNLRTLSKAGVWLQGNFRCMTGEEGFNPDQLIRQFMQKNLYTFLGLDMHRPESLESRLDGLSLAETEFGAARVEELINQSPRRMILGL